jgi:anaerobic selenocysteine-containing dehydrogenase
MGSKINRRDFLQFTGAGALGVGAGVLYGESIKKNVELLVPQVVPPEDYSPGIATWYNTVCNQCSAGCGIQVRTREGRAKFIAGNPAHPVSQGRICPRGQGGLNALYNPDRIRTPLKRDGERGSGQYVEISWTDAMNEVSAKLGNLNIQGLAGGVHLLSGSERGHLHELFSVFMQQLESSHYQQYDFSHPHNLIEANRQCFGEADLPYYDIGNTQFLLSFGADYLGTWLSPVHHSIAYGNLRQGSSHRGTCVQVEPRMSLSGASADKWMQAKPGSEGLVALAMCHAIVEHGWYQGDDVAAWSEILSDWHADELVDATGVGHEDLHHLAESFAKAGPSLAIGASGHSVATHIAINCLNYLGGNIGEAGGIVFNAPPVFSHEQSPPLATTSDMQAFAEELSADSSEVLLIHNTNPIFNLPDSTQLSDAIKTVPMVVAMASFLDETSVMADIILPTDTYLEAWGDDQPAPGAGFPIASITQPVVHRVFDTRSAGDIILALARQIGGELPAAMPWTTMQDYLKARWRELYSAKQADGGDTGFDQFWHDVLKSGVWGEKVAATEKSKTDISAAMLAAVGPAEPVFSGDEETYPFAFHPYLSQAFGDGRGANLPWMQEMPDPLTSVVYNSWVELNPATAASLGISEGDVLKIESPAGELEAPAFIYNGIRPDVIAMPIGQGHTSYGRYAENRGVNPLKILAAATDPVSGELAAGATRIRLSKTGQRVPLIKTDGTTRTLGRSNILGSGTGGHG